MNTLIPVASPKTDASPTPARKPVGPDPQQEEAVQPKPGKLRLIIGISIAAIVLLLIVVFAYRSMHRPLPEGLIQANGRIEGDRVTVASKFPGRIAQLWAREGNSVTQGQALAKLDDAQLQAKMSQARAGVATLVAQLKAAQSSLDLSQQEVPLAIEMSQAAVSNSEALLTKAVAAHTQASRDATRYQQLLASGSVENHRSEMSNLAAASASADLAAAHAGLTHAQKQLDHSRLGSVRIRAQYEGVQALAAQVEQSRAVQKETESMMDDLTLTAPISGVITTRVRDAGEVIAAGAPVFDLVNLDRLYLKVYVPESQMGKLRLDLPAQVYVDAFPKNPFAARTRYIASRAEFTPKEVQTPDERVKLVYAVKLYLEENPDHRLTPGLPADAVIRWQQDTPWQPPRW